MFQVVLIKADEKNKLPSINDLKAAGFHLSSALHLDTKAKGTETVTTPKAKKRAMGGSASFTKGPG
ncbi:MULTISPECIES: hypothetical protein [unclassified Pseudodesulfovibrio]|uniref:hypothetical protein n=1 Tax=unclassified Pseudodesulfovibrio TaxID=2661612 RepID=UPI000FEBA300|nr:MULTISPECIES: hypothetical protein [unclassified Pseudodesulfovibrio]MCJ2166013.1 hypothetical protein [Pseudodesulfovibrio sp. S3-i]RWU02548.1 hypothetical protein DWB63_15720 [Pseudodesulfovibrio sp. S3]